MSSKRGLCSTLATFLVVATGCQKLDVTTTLSLDPGVFKEFQVSAPSGEQKVTVQVKSSACPVSAYIILEADVAAARKAVEDYAKPPRSAASKQKTQEFTLEATIPAKSPFVVLVSEATKATSVEVKVTGR